MGVRFEQVHDRVWRVPTLYLPGTQTNIYIVRGVMTAVIDTGVIGSPTHDVVPALASLGLSISDVDLVLNTHGHVDHLGGNAEMKDAGAEIALHHADRPLADSNEFHAQRLRELFPTIDADHLRPAREASLMRLLGRAVGVDRLLDDGDVVDLGVGVRLTVVHTPGHTVGSVCYWWEQAGMLLTGDSIQGRGVHAGSLPIVEEPASYAASVVRARDLRPRTLLMGHAFQGREGALGPVAHGERVDDAFQESLHTHDLLRRSFARAVQTAPAASGSEVARRALADFATHLPLSIDEATGFPGGYFWTLPGYLAMARQAAAEG
jgi:glyoxylase-like metal-dependent hydrolase (beta-lactamase superfamily II)